MLVGAHGLAGDEVVGDVREVEEEGDGVDEEDGADFGADGGRVKHVRADDAAIPTFLISCEHCWGERGGDKRVGDEDEFVPAVGFEDAVDLGAGFVFLERGRGDAEADLHDFDGDDADAGLGGVAGDGADFGEEVHVGVEADADAVDEDDGELVLGGVGTVPVGEVGGWGEGFGEEVVGAEREDGEVVAAGGAVVVEFVVVEAGGCDGVDHEDTL